ncbi:MAG: PhnA domain-containing protein [Thalassolituus sp.]|jgi:protein PhnA|nr:MAG: PhnA domain protein [Oceanobacter sp.]
MSVEHILKHRSGGKCELCGAENDLAVYQIPPESDLESADNSVLLCGTCLPQAQGGELDVNHMRCLSDSMWSQEPPVQVLAYRLLVRLNSESWAQDALDMIYMDDETRKWAEKSVASEQRDVTLDSNGAELAAGDNVTLIKDLEVKGANFTAKRGTVVRGISLSNNPLHIEGKVNGSRIVIIAAYCKKA